MSKVRGRSREDPMPKGRLRPRGVTPRPRSGAAAESIRLRRHRNSREELPRVRGQGGRPRGDTQSPRSGAVMRGVTPRLRSGAEARRSYPTPLSPRPGAAARRSNPCSRPGAATRGVTPHPRSGAAAGRSYPTTLRPRPGAVAGRSNPGQGQGLRREELPGPWLCGHRRA